MQDRTPKHPGRVKLVPVDAANGLYDMVRADEPTQTGDPLNKNTFLKDETAALFGLDETAVPDDVFAWIGEWGRTNWKLLAEYKVAGTYTFVVPNDVDELGVLMIGGGGAGGVARGYYTAQATGGGSGQLKQFVLKKSVDFVAGETLAAVVGAGGQRKSYSAPTSTDNGSYTATTGNAGGSSSFAGVTANGGPGGSGWASSMDSGGGSSKTSGGTGQPSDDYTTLIAKAPYGLINYSSSLITPRTTSPGFGARNIFDDTDLHIYCGAGGCAGFSNSSEIDEFEQGIVTRARGSAGAGSSTLKSSKVQAFDATAPGDGGGAAAYNLRYEISNGAGADGLILVYGRKTL